MSTKAAPPQPRSQDPVDKKYSDADLEDIFLTNALDQYKFFKHQADRLRTAGLDPAMCEQYAEAHRLLLNRFTWVEETQQQTEDEL